MSEADGVDIPLSIDTEQAARNLTNLESAAEALDTRLQRLEQTATRLANNLKLPNPDTGKAQTFDSYADAQGYLSNLSPNHLWSLSPQLGQVMSEIGAQRDQIATRVGSYGMANPLQVATTTGQPLYNAYAGWTPQAPAQQAPAPFGGGTPQDTDRTATMFGERFAQALSRAGAGAIGSAASGALGGAGLGAAGDVVSGLVRSLGAEVLAPLAVGAAAVGLGLAANSKVTQYHQEEYGLGGAVGNTLGVGTAHQLIGVQQTGWTFQYSETDAVKAAQQLGLAGVGQGDINGALANSMALSRLSGGTLSLDQTTGLTGDLMKGGFSNAQVGQAYDEMSKQANLTGVSLDRLVTSMQALERTAGVSALNVNGVAAVQALAGSSINVGQALGPAVGATGAQALRQAAILGLSPAAFTRAQGNMPQLWDAYAGLAKRYDQGPYGTHVAEEMLQSAGFDMSGLSGPAASTLVQKLVSQGPQAAEQYYNSLQKKEGPATTQDPAKAMDDILAKGKQAADQTTTAMQQAAIDAERIQAALLLAADAANKIHTPLSTGEATATAQMEKANRAYYRQGMETGDQYTASGVNDPSGDPQFGPLSEYSLHDARQNGLWVGGGPGKGSFMDPMTFHAYESAARKTGVPLAVLLAQAKQEATNKQGQIDGSIVSSDGGYGLGQFTDQGAAVKYLGAASKQLGDGTVTAKNWHQYALNPQVAALAQSLYDADLYKSTGGDWQVALAQYDGGSHPGAAANQYGFSVYQGAENVQHDLAITVTVKDEQTGKTVTQQKSTHTVNTTRKPVAHQTYGPGGRHHTPPTPPKKH